MMKSADRISSSSTEVIALICAILGWVTFGFLAVPGLMIAHILAGSYRRNGISKSATNRATLVVGYSSILMAPTLIVAGYLFLRIRVQKFDNQVVGSEPFDFNRMTEVSRGEPLWLIVALALFVFVILLPAVIRLAALLVTRYQERAILKGNEAR